MFESEGRYEGFSGTSSQISQFSLWIHQNLWQFWGLILFQVLGFEVHSGLRLDFCAPGWAYPSCCLEHQRWGNRTIGESLPSLDFTREINHFMDIFHGMYDITNCLTITNSSMQCLLELNGTKISETMTEFFWFGDPTVTVGPRLGKSFGPSDLDFHIPIGKSIIWEMYSAFFLRLVFDAFFNPLSWWWNSYFCWLDLG